MNNYTSMRWLCAWSLSISCIAIAAPVYSFFNPTIHGRVLDAESGKPIEGAIALCVWTKKNYFGIEVTTSLAKVSEAVSDKVGQFTVEGKSGFFLDPPDLTIYKRGYRAWNNNIIFPTKSERTDFAWANNFVVRLQRWKEGDSFNDHEAFIATQTAGARTKAFADAMDWERTERVRENDIINERRRNLK